MHNGSLDKSNNGYRRIPIGLQLIPCNIVILIRNDISKFKTILWVSRINENALDLVTHMKKEM